MRLIGDPLNMARNAASSSPARSASFDGLRLIDQAARWTWWIGVGLLWIAAALTLVTGLDYFRKALPHLKDSGAASIVNMGGVASHAGFPERAHVAAAKAGLEEEAS